MHTHHTAAEVEALEVNEYPMVPHRSPLFQSYKPNGSYVRPEYGPSDPLALVLVLHA